MIEIDVDLVAYADRLHRSTCSRQSRQHSTKPATKS
jgi:hypothetical protein